MASASSNTLASNAEIDAALQGAAANPTTIPSLDGGTTVPVVPVPVEAPPRPRTAPAEEPARGGVATAPSPTADPPDIAAADYGGHGFIYRTLDLVLWLINRPLQFVTPSARRLVGFAALVTIGTSALALYLLPKLLLPRDTISVLKRQVADVRAAAAAATPHEP